MSHPQYAIHISLVSAQPTPNLTPVLDPALAPQRVILIVSPDMRQRARWLADVLEGRSIRVEQWPIEDPWDIEHVQQRVLELLDSKQTALGEKSIVLNVTGGTKPMSIAAYETCRLYELPIFYVHPEHDRLVWLYPPEQPPHDLADRIKLEPFLQAHGVMLERPCQRNVPDSRWLDTGEEIIRRIDRYQKALGQLNWLAATAQQNLVSEPMNKKNLELLELIDLFRDGGHLRLTGSQITFSDQASRFFVNGGWLEILVFDAVRKIRRQDDRIQDIAHGVHVLRQQRGKRIPNELDIAFLRDNRLHIIECKTARFRGEGEDSPGAEALYKLDSLTDLMGGLRARAMLVSYRDIPGYDRTRAANLGIQICAGGQLQHLREHIQRLTQA